MLLFKELEDCLFLLLTTVNVRNNPINNTNSRVLRNSHTKYFLPRVNITNYNVLIGDGTFMINQLMTW